MLGISFDDVSSSAAFARKFAFPFTLLCDTDRQVAVAYGACRDATARYPNRISYLIDERGTIAKAYPTVNAAEHASQVVADLAGK